ncbi:unnamed protein product [Rotaria socialis]|uniref:Uncharacterized protein n=1 Tax=Rotaria socialis TaxID=392032 RepID=A0A821C2F8_9BILA|nr:unnamed protein product [Rotaria socialis]
MRDGTYFSSSRGALVQGIPIQVILQLAILVLKQTAFVDDDNIYTSMPASNQRSTSTTNRPFTIVLTDNSELLRHTHAFQFPVNYNNFFPQITHQRHTIHPVQNGANNNNDDIPEQLLNNLLGLEL